MFFYISNAHAAVPYACIFKSLWLVCPCKNNPHGGYWRYLLLLYCLLYIGVFLQTSKNYIGAFYSPFYPLQVRILGLSWRGRRLQNGSTPLKTNPCLFPVQQLQMIIGLFYPLHRVQHTVAAKGMVIIPVPAWKVFLHHMLLCIPVPRRYIGFRAKHIINT